jgi:putative ABC transport system permease protein
VLAIAFSVMLLLGVEKVRTGARQASPTPSRHDLIVGRAAQHQLLLYSVFRIGNATNNVTWRAIPTSPSGRGRLDRAAVARRQPASACWGRRDYFRHYKYRHGQTLKLAAGARSATYSMW